VVLSQAEIFWSEEISKGTLIGMIIDEEHMCQEKEVIRP